MARRNGGALIVADNLGIKFPGRRRTLPPGRHFLTRSTSFAPDGGGWWALRGVSFTIRQGEAVGLIGAEGAGKSTLLKLIAGLMLPDEGRVDCPPASVASMIELTGGFNHDLTVDESIRLAAGLHGLTKDEIERRFAGIVEWAEIGQRLGTPFRHLSGAMKARVGFSVISSTDRPILLLDEVLSVDDRAFQQKCFVRIEEMLGHGRTVVLVSRDEIHIRRFCKRALYLRRGSLVGDGPVGEIWARYEQE